MGMNAIQRVMGFDDAHPIDLKRLYSTPENRLHVHYVASSTNEEQLTLTLVPNSTKTLRKEQASIHSEAVLLQWLSISHLSCLANEGQMNSSTHGRVSQGSDTGGKLPKNTPPFKNILPRVVKYGRAKFPSDVEFLLTKRVHGAILTSLGNALSKAQQRCIDFQIGQLIRDLSVHQSPNGHFGATSTVLKAANMHHTVTKALPAVTEDDVIHTRWSDFFLSLLESVLRDAEDAALSLEYDRLRFHAGRFKEILDEVTVPCLVVLDAGEDFNTRIIASDRSAAQEPQGSVQQHGPVCLETKEPQTAAMPSRAVNQSRSKTQTNAQCESVPVPVPIRMLETPDAPKVIGIQDWHNSIFGDPLFTSVLTRSKNMDMWNGLIHQVGEMESKAIKQAIHLAKNFRHVGVRQLLYDCYHSVVTIVTEYYRVTVDGDDRELPARRRLVQAIGRLDDLDDLGREKHPNPSSAHPIAKRKKSG